MLLSDDQYEELRESFRGACLAGLDAAMNEVCDRAGKPAIRNDSGARDADLPELFKALDAQFDRNLEVLGFIRESTLADDLEKAEQRWASQ